MIDKEGNKMLLRIKNIFDCNSNKISKILLGIAFLSIILSIFFPYWHLHLQAPQYPKGLDMHLYVNKLVGDVREIDILNHYIGMKTLEQGAIFERSISLYAISLMLFSTVLAIFINNKWAFLFTLPILIYPIIFFLDLFYWLNLFGQNLDPRAPLSSSVDPFTPPLFGSKAIANFVVITSAGIGLYLVFFADILVLASVYCQKKIQNIPIHK